MEDISKLQINIGQAIRNGLEKHHMIQRDLAEMLGKSVSLVSEWTRNAKTPSGDDLIKIAVLLNIVEELFPGYCKKETVGGVVIANEVTQETINQYFKTFEDVQRQLRDMDSKIKSIQEQLEKEKNTHSVR